MLLPLALLTGSVVDAHGVGRAGITVSVNDFAPGRGQDGADLSVEWTADAMPAFPWQHDPFRGEAVFAELQEGALLVADRGTQAGDYLYFSYPWNASAEEQNVAEFEMKVLSGWSNIMLSNGLATERIYLYPDRITASHSGLRHDMDTTDDFHTYRFVQRGDDLLIYVDDELCLDATGRFTEPAVRNDIRFGAANSTSVGEALWRAVRFRTTGGARARTDEGLYYPIHPGRANTIAVEADFEVLRVAGLSARLIRTLPDGRTQESSAALTPDTAEAVFDLGAFAVPAHYEYEHGVVYRRGTRCALTLTDTATGEVLAHYGLYQGPARRHDSEALWAGDLERHVYDSGFDGGRGWRPNDESGAPMDPPFLLRLDPAVLSDMNDVRVQWRHKDGLALPATPAELVVSALADGGEMHRADVTITGGWDDLPLDVTAWPEGDYRIELRPTIEGTDDREGPAVVYRRRAVDPRRVQVSPLAPWALMRDPAREELVIDDFAAAVAQWGVGAPDPEKWQVGERLVGAGDIWAEPVVLRPGLEGHYAVFAAHLTRCYVSVGADGLVREVGRGEPFLVATDMTDGQVALYQSGTPGELLSRLRFVPVTAESVAAFERETAHPPARLAGVADWHDFFAVAGPRLDADQIDMLVKGHGEIGMRDLQWAIGRSWVEYHSALPNASRWPAVPLSELPEETLQRYPHFPAWDHVTNAYCPLTEALASRVRHDVRLWPWLAMQRHYGPSYGGVFASRWFMDNPQWWRWRKRATQPDRSEVCYFFPEVRAERVDIFCEVAEKSPEGLVVGCSRQVPMLLYHPEMVAAYKERTGIDPQTIDASAGKAYEDWIRWRADFFTETLRELKARLDPIRERTGLPIPVAIRVPSAGLFYNLAQGTDVEAWCREGLIDVLQLTPLDDRGGRGSHDIRPYLDLGRRYGIPVLGGINGNTFRNFPVILKRSLGLLEAGVEGIEIYESNNFSRMEDRRWLIPLLGNAARMRDFLEHSNLEACYPVQATTACAGFDNHSFGTGWNVFEGDGNPL